MNLRLKESIIKLQIQQTKEEENLIYKKNPNKKKILLNSKIANNLQQEKNRTNRRLLSYSII